MPNLRHPSAIASMKKPIDGRSLWRWATLIASACCFFSPSIARGQGASSYEAKITKQMCMTGPSASLAQAESARGDAEVTAAGVLPNPSFVFDYQHTLTNIVDRQSIYGLSVPLGIGGRRWVLQDAAEARADEARFAGRSALFESALAFREAYGKALVDAARAEVLKRQQKEIDAFSKTIEALRKGGETAGYDALRQRIQARVHRAQLSAAEARAHASQTRLEAWTGSAVEIPSSALEEFSSIAAVPAMAGARSTSLRIRTYEAAARASRLEAKAANRQWVPDIDLFAGFRRIRAGDDTGDGFAVSVSVPLTLFDHGQGGAARASAEMKTAQASAAALRAQSKAELKAAAMLVEALSENLGDTEQARLDALALQERARQLYGAGEATITELLDAYRSAEEAQLADLNMLEEVAMARVSLMRVAGTMFDGSLDEACGGNGGTRNE